MYFSYSVNQQVILQDIALPLTAGKVYLITGVENVNLGILAGIIAKLIPATAHSPLPQIAALIENYTGELVVTEGKLSQTVAYVGVDPDRHFLFATVAEEIRAQLGAVDDVKILATFGLTPDFLERQIITLSGGEKMRLALAMAFAMPSDLYVMHGCIPWLDKVGRELLQAHIIKAKHSNASVIVIEHEVHTLAQVVDEVLVFDGKTLQAQEREAFFAEEFSTSQSNQFAWRTATPAQENILEFKQINFSYPSQSRSTLLTDVSFGLQLGKNYVLLGENGAGKSTIAQMIFRALHPQHGTIVLKNKLLTAYLRAELNKIIGYVGQFPLQQITLSTVGEYKQQLERTQNSSVLMLFTHYLNLPNDFPVSSLSFWQLKILCLLSVLAPTTEMIILDEPTWGIDQNGKTVLWSLLQEISKTLKFTLLVITHDLELIYTLHPEIFWLNKGTVSMFKNSAEFKNCPQVQQYFTSNENTNA